MSWWLALLLGVSVFPVFLGMWMGGIWMLAKVYDWEQRWRR